MQQFNQYIVDQIHPNMWGVWLDVSDTWTGPDIWSYRHYEPLELFETEDQAKAWIESQLSKGA